LFTNLKNYYYYYYYQGRTHSTQTERKTDKQTENKYKL